MRYIQASGATFVRHVIDNGEPTFWDENHNARPSKLTPEEAASFGVFKLQLVTPPPHNPLTQTRTDANAVLVAGVWTQKWVIANMPVDEAATVLTAAKAAFILQIDADADALIRAVIGERAGEYELAEKEAAAYKAAGYTGTVPGSVASWAAAKGWTATQAADSVMLAAAGWRKAQSAMRAQRLGLKEAARLAADGPALDAMKAQWADFCVQLKSSLIG